MAIKHGVFYSIEVKTPAGKLSDSQKLWLQDVTDHGGIALVVRSLDDLINQLKSVTLKP